MRNFDFTPLYRSTVGFDRLANLIDSALDSDGATGGYPPYNIEKTDENTYRITLAVAGFSEKDLEIEARDGQLEVSGRKQDENQKVTYLHRGIATRAFKKRFQLAEHVRVTQAIAQDGLLHIDLVREIPEALKPRKIEISTESKQQVLEAAE